LHNRKDVARAVRDHPFNDTVSGVAKDALMSERRKFQDFAMLISAADDVGDSGKKLPLLSKANPRGEVCQR
jgi:hypothetical protein